ncbi:MAG: hypothetical protein OXG08_00410 [Gammaproteobacteria bacterium]|nr:hypothetical protein [Gammaproteobacteria bacterium]
MASLANRISKQARNDEGEILITVETTDGLDSFESHDPAFLTSADMPSKIKSVHISYGTYAAPIRAVLSTTENRFVQEIQGSLLLTVEGTAAGVEQLFRDLERELAARQVFGSLIVRANEKIWPSVIGGALTGVAVFCTFDIVIDVWLRFYPEIKGSLSFFVVGFIGIFSSLICFVASPFYFSHIVKKNLPPVEFCNHVTHRNTNVNSKFFWIATIIVIPIFVNIFSQLLFSVLGFWFTGS